MKSSDTSRKEKAKNRKKKEGKVFFLLSVIIMILILVLVFLVNRRGEIKIPKETSNVKAESATNENITNVNKNNKKETDSVSTSTDIVNNNSIEENKNNTNNNNKDDNDNKKEEENTNIDNSKTKYSYGKYTISKSDASTENIGFWFGRNKDFKRPEAPLTIEDFKKYNAYYLGEDEKVIYLTFDEGLNNTQAEKNLDTLKKHNIKGTFFFFF